MLALTFPGSNREKSSHFLFHILTAAVRALHVLMIVRVQRQDGFK
jgi:hypothetical protein